MNELRESGGVDGKLLQQQAPQAKKNALVKKLSYMSEDFVLANEKNVLAVQTYHKRKRPIISASFRRVS
jgi:hypothetical protein